MKLNGYTALAAVVLIGTAAPAVAQNAATTTADPYATTAPVEDDDDTDIPWGLLGLLGLAGLMGRKKDNHDNVRRTDDNKRL
jgi:hypothetical protein